MASFFAGSFCFAIVYQKMNQQVYSAADTNSLPVKSGFNPHANAEMIVQQGFYCN
jgi:hypothetical protein